MKKLYFYLLPLLLLLALPACTITPRWQSLQKTNDIVALKTFDEAAITKNQTENNRQYQEHQFDYRASIAGIPAAEATFWLKRNRNNTYQARGEFNILSPWTIIVRAAGRQETIGRIRGTRFRPQKMEAFYQVGTRKKYQLKVTYPPSGTAPTTILQPKRKTKNLSPVDPKLLAQSYDLTSTLLTLMAQYQRGGIQGVCKQSLLLWDGFRLSRIKLRLNPDEENSCLGDFEGLGGFTKKYYETAKEKPIVLYFKVDKRFPLPLEIRAETASISPQLTMTSINGIPISYYYLPENLDTLPFWDK